MPDLFADYRATMGETALFQSLSDPAALKAFNESIKASLRPPGAPTPHPPA